MATPAELVLFSEIVGAIYDAALDRQRWYAALEKIRDYLGAKTAAIASYDVLDRNPPWDMGLGYDPYWMQLLTEKYGKLNPYLGVVAEMGCGEAAYGTARPDYADVRNSIYYTEWMKPQDLWDASVLVFDKSLTSIGTLVTVKAESAGNFGPDVIDKYALLFPHVRRSVLIGRTIGALEDEKAELSAVLDGLTSGVIVLRASGAIAQANRAGAAMLDARAPVARVGGKLELPTGAAQGAFDRALAAMARGDVSAQEKGVSIPLAGAAGRFSLHLLPLDVGRGQAIHAGSDAIAVAFIRPVTSSQADAVARLAELHGLTDRERDVLEALVDIGGIPMVADILGISQTTVRTHVTNIFDKTGVRRQTGLIRLLMEMQAPPP